MRCDGTTKTWLARCIGKTIVLAAALLSAGCTHIVTQDVAFYNNGPQQPEPPQGDLKQGTRCWVMGHEGGYVRVWTLDGVNAFVWERAVMTIRDWEKKQEDEKRQAEVREKLSRARQQPQPTPATSQPGEAPEN